MVLRPANAPIREVRSPILAAMDRFATIFVQLLFYALWLVLIGRVLVSWLNPRFEGPIGRFLFETTEPILRPIRKVLPQSGTIDFSPLVAFLMLSLIGAAVGLR
ncbi:hypothetical protein BH20CHL6_BH20CHL6_13890 [soil metagenome]